METPELTLLASAVRSRKVDVIDLLLLNKSINVNAVNMMGQSALDIAIIKGYENIVKMFLYRRGGDLVPGNSLYYSSLHPMISVILLKSQLFYTTNQLMRTAFAAFITKNFDIVYLVLCRSQSDYNTTVEGYSLLMLAAKNGCQEICLKLLTRINLNVTALSPENQMAHEIARSYGHIQIAQKIMNYAFWQGTINSLMAHSIRITVDSFSPFNNPGLAANLQAPLRSRVYTPHINICSATPTSSSTSTTNPVQFARTSQKPQTAETLQQPQTSETSQQTVLVPVSRGTNRIVDNLNNVSTKRRRKSLSTENSDDDEATGANIFARSCNGRKAPKFQ